jgi:hypothetical protein
LVPLARVFPGTGHAPVFEKEIVELRRVDASMLKLHMGLTAMVHLMLEQMRQQVADGLGRRAVPPLGLTRRSRSASVSPVQNASSRASDAACAAPSSAASSDLGAVIDRAAQATLRQGVDIVEIDLVDVVQRGRERGEEPGRCAVNASAAGVVTAP